MRSAGFIVTDIQDAGPYHYVITGKTIMELFCVCVEFKQFMLKPFWFILVGGVVCAFVDYKFCVGKFIQLRCACLRLQLYCLGNPKLWLWKT